MSVTPRHPLARRQHGVVLVTGLIFLVILTLIGVTALTNTMMEERMAGNTRDQEVAFEAAEAAVRDAETFLEAATLPSFNGSNGLYSQEAAPAPEWDAVTWTNARAYADDDFAGKTADSPRYLIEEQPATPDPGGSLAAGEALDEARVYLITARGVGANANTRVVLETAYKR